MVMGNLLAKLAATIENRLVSSGLSLKTFCIGFSLVGQLCGFAGKYSRQRSLLLATNDLTDNSNLIFIALQWKEYLH